MKHLTKAFWIVVRSFGMFHAIIHLASTNLSDSEIGWGTDCSPSKPCTTNHPDTFRERSDPEAVFLGTQYHSMCCKSAFYDPPTFFKSTPFPPPSPQKVNTTGYLFHPHCHHLSDPKIQGNLGRQLALCHLKPKKRSWGINQGLNVAQIYPSGSSGCQKES